MKLEKDMLIVNKLGLHARAATQLVQLANKFSSSIQMIQDDKQAPADSVLALMMLESSQGKQIKVICDGDDAHDAMEAIEQLIVNRFNESE